MPRTRNRPPQGPNAFVASAARARAGAYRGRPRQSSATGWQAEAWGMLDSVGELEFYRQWKANAMSRCTLWVGEETIEDGEKVVKPTSDPVANAALSALFGGTDGQAQMLSIMGGHIAIPGETWLCGLPEPSDDPDGPDQWRVLSHSEVTDQPGQWVIERGDGVQETYYDTPERPEVFMARIWNPHPAKWVHATSAVRGALPILRVLLGLSKRVGRDIDSRLAGAGLLVVPSEITLHAPRHADDTEGDGADPDIDPLLADMIESMTTAMADPGDVSAVMPVMLKAPGEYLKYIKHLTFATPFDERTEELTDRHIQRLATSLACPAEVLTGMADVNHWTGWLTDENAIKMYLEPDLGIITHGLTTKYLWPAMQGDADVFDTGLRRFRIMGDTSALRTRPNRSAEANSGHERIVITDAAYAREVGFEPDDLLDPASDEFRRRTLMRLAATGDPAVAIPALIALGVSIPDDLAAAVTPAPAAPPAVTAGEDTQAIEARRTLPQQPTTAPMEQIAAALATSETLVARAVERAWNKAGRRGKTRTPVPAALLDGAMADAWAGVPRAANLLGLNAETLTATLDRYARGLLASGAPHDPNLLASLLRDEVLPAGRWG